MARVRVLTLILIIATCEGFMFDQLSNGLRCKGITMLCPPMCQRQDAQGCTICDCTNIDPSHPKAPGSGNTGGYFDPSNPLSGHNKFPGGTACDDWTKCACVKTINAETGCLECTCGPSQVSPLTSSTPPPTKHSMMSTNSHQTPSSSASVPSSGSTLPYSSSSLSQSTTNSQIGISTRTSTSTKTTLNYSSGNQSNSPGGMSTNQLSYSSATPPYMTSVSTSNQGSTSKPVTSTTSVPQRPSTATSTNVDTNLPSVATIPALSTVTTILSTSTMAPFVCPGVFSCSLDCYAGFAMDKNGCPVCECAPIPTDLP